jgi:hypothetical protein
LKFWRTQPAAARAAVASLRKKEKHLGPKTFGLEFALRDLGELLPVVRLLVGNAELLECVNITACTM